MRSKLRHNSGLTLVELMVSLAIGAALMLAGATLFLNSRQSYVQDEQAAYVQEVGRYSLRFLSRELGLAGFVGGVQQPELIEVEQTLLNGAELTPSSNCYHFLLNVAEGLSHFNNVTEQGLETDGNGTATGRSLPTDCFSDSETLMQDSDVLVVRRVKDSPTVIQGAEQASVNATATYLSIVRHNESFVLDTGSASNLANDEASSDTWAETDLWEYMPQLLYVRVRDSGRCSNDTYETVELCRLRLNQSGSGLAPTQCLVEGVERINVVYGLDTDDDLFVDSFTEQPTPADLENAISARLTVLARSDQTDSRYNDDKSYELGSVIFIPSADDNLCNDRIRRSMFGSTVLLRNMDAVGL
jgi:type IV pilus assembly protein PilW